MGDTLANLLNQHLVSNQMSFKKLASAAGLSPATVHRWTTGVSNKVQQWQDLAKIAHVFGLDRAQTSELLIAGGLPPLAALERRGLDEADRMLLSRWPNRLPPSNVPARLSRFIGRDQECADLAAALASERLVTVTGTGGSGKTRLALEVAHAIQPQVDRAYFVELASLTGPGDVIPAIADTLGFLRQDKESVLSAIAAHLQGYRVLLVLDNFEHLLEAGPQIVVLQQVASSVTVLVTSRTFLHVRGEHEYALDPLPLPRSASSYDDLIDNPAVALFADRAHSANRHFQISIDNVSSVAAICRRLDGLPLAIELAAARIRELSLDTMQRHFASPLDLASDGPRDASRRQSALRETIAWSYALLDRVPQRWFMLLSVFAGGFTRETMAAVGEGVGLGASTVTPGLMALVTHRLVRKQPPSSEKAHRYTMLETIRDFAVEQLDRSGLLAAARGAHATLCIDLAERADYSGPDQASWYARIAQERDNIHAALDWCREQRDHAAGLRLTLAMMPYWEQRNMAEDSLAWLQTFMDAADTVPPSLWARGLVYLGLLSLNDTSDHAAVLQCFEEALRIVREQDDPAWESEVLRAFGDAHVHWREWDAARQCYQDSLEVAERAGDARRIALSYMGLAFSSHIDEALPFWEQTLTWSQRSGHRETIAKATNSLGELARYRGDWEPAERNYHLALTTGRELESDFLIALATHNLGYVAIGNGDLPMATARFAESLRRYQGMRHRKGMAECLAGLARVAVLKGNDDRAARLCGAVDCLLAELRTQFDTLDRVDYERTLQTLQDRLGPKLDALLALGRAMLRDDAIRYALDQLQDAGRPA